MPKGKCKPAEPAICSDESNEPLEKNVTILSKEQHRRLRLACLVFAEPIPHLYDIVNDIAERDGDNIEATLQKVEKSALAYHTCVGGRNLTRPLKLNLAVIALQCGRLSSSDLSLLARGACKCGVPKQEIRNVLKAYNG